MPGLGELLRDRRAWAIAGVGAAGGGVVYLRRRSAGAGGSGDGASGSVITPGVADTTSTDLYNSLQPQIEYLQRQGEILGSSVQSIEDILNGLGTTQPVPTTPARPRLQPPARTTWPPPGQTGSRTWPPRRPRL